MEPLNAIGIQTETVGATFETITDEIMNQKMNQKILETMNDKIGTKTNNVPCGMKLPRQLIANTESIDATVMTAVAMKFRYEQCPFKRRKVGFNVPRGGLAHLKYQHFLFFLRLPLMFFQCFGAATVGLFMLLAEKQLDGEKNEKGRKSGGWRRNRGRSGCLVLFLVASVQVATCAPVTETKVDAWSTALSLKFANFLDETMKMPTLQKLYDDVPTTTTTKEGRVLAASVAAEIASLINDKDHELRLLAKKCADKKTTNEMIQSTQILLVQKLKAQGDDQIMRTYFTSHDNGEIVLHSSVSGAADEEAPAASTSGYTTIHPPSGNKELDPPFPFVETNIYDARRTSWYSNAVAGPKDVFVVVDETNMGSDATRWEAVKNTLLHVLNTISPNDNVWIHRKTEAGSSSSSSSMHGSEEQKTSGVPLLKPLGGKSCAVGEPVRGKSSVIQQLSDVVQKMQLSTTLAAEPASSSDDWLNMLNTTMNAIDYFRSHHVSNTERAGVVLLVSTGAMERQSVQNAIVPFVLDRNLHRLPIITYHIAETVAATPSTEKLAYSCTDLGTSAWLTSSSHPADAGLYYEHIVQAPSTKLSSQKDPLTSRLSSVSL